MKTLTIISDNEKRDLVKATVTTKTFKHYIGKPLTMVGVVIYEKEEKDEDGVEKTVTVTAIKTSEGEFVSSISPTVKATVDTIINAFGEDGIKAGVDVEIKSEKSNSGRDFIYLDLA